MTADNGLDDNTTTRDEASTSQTHASETEVKGHYDVEGSKENSHKAKEKQATNTVPFYKLFTFADSMDKILMIVGSIGAIGNGFVPAAYDDSFRRTD
ncbi:UNVERIFIED_CONTAM: ABC transporter B family member 11 [Sesamum angustifolium]|uniref:ABC transporter B family member 11 n=1 Tax=Sesamum angustifolium TaxID=2727405 RepID=A0AAW2QSK9_9LAMI